jgi:ankyrin repeat protein
MGWPFAEATALHLLIALGSKSAFDEFLQQDNVQLDGRDAEGNTPLLLAIREDKQDMALALLNRSIVWRLRQSEGVEQSINSARTREPERSYPVDINTENNDGETPLTVALTNNTGEVIHTLLEAGADPKYLGQESALVSYAIRNRDEPLLMKLIEKKVNLDGAVHLALKEIKDNDDLLKRFILELLHAGADTMRSLEFDKGNGTHSEDESDDDDERDDEAILLASRSGQTAIVNLLLLYEVPATSQNRYGEFPLLVATENGHREIVEILLQAEPAAVEMRGNRRQSALVTAIDEDEIDIAMLLIQKGSFQLSSAALLKGLSRAIEKDMPDLMEIILRKDESLLGIEFDSNQTPLSLAAANGCEAVVKLLLWAGVDPESKGRLIRTPLSLAAENGSEAVVKLLLKAGASMESKDTYNRTPLYHAALKGCETVVKLLLEAGANPESKDIYNLTPLSVAALNGHGPAVKLLLQAGANLESRCISDQAPLFHAAWNGHEVVVKLLLEAGANPESKDINQHTPLILAAKGGHTAAVKLLLEAGANTESRDVSNQTALLLAVERGHDAVVKLLLEAGANPESKDVDDRSPLFSAAESGYEGVVKLLLEAGAKLEAKSSRGQTPLSCAASYGRAAVVKLLLEAGANPKTRDSSRSAPLSWDSSEEA